MSDINGKEIEIGGSWYRVVRWKAFPLSPSPQQVLLLEPIAAPITQEDKDAR